MITEGSEVVFEGEASSYGPGPGDRGKVLLAHETGAHVSWTTGSRAGEITLERQEDVRVSGKNAIQASLDDSLWLPSEPVTATMSATAVYAQEGAMGVISALDQQGALDSVTEVVESALDTIRHKIATLLDEGVRLDEDARDDVVERLTARAVREVLEDEDEADG